MKNEIQKRMIEAMKAKNNDLVMVLRDIKNKLAQAEKEKKEELTKKDCIDVLTKMAKARKQSIEMYQKSTRTDLVEKEQNELDIIEEYLPKQMEKDEIASAVMEIVKDNGFSGMQDMGKVMKEFNANFSGQDGKEVSNIVKQVLSSMTH